MCTPRTQNNGISVTLFAFLIGIFYGSLMIYTILAIFGVIEPPEPLQDIIAKEQEYICNNLPHDTPYDLIYKNNAYMHQYIVFTEIRNTMHKIKCIK